LLNHVWKRGQKEFIAIRLPVLTSFPDVIEQAEEFEKNCARIKAIIYSSGGSDVIDIKNNNLSLFNIDSLFQKQFRL
jgi:hypothetical protein